MSKEEIYSEIVEFLKGKGATKVAVFGSYVRNEETPESDINVMMGFSDTITIFDFVGYKFDLEEKLGIEVDLVMEDGINPLLSRYIMKDQKILYN